MFRTNGQADRILPDSLILQFLLFQLAVCGRRRMYHKTFHISYIGKQRKDLQAVNKLMGCCLSSFNLKRKN